MKNKIKDRILSLVEKEKENEVDLPKINHNNNHYIKKAIMDLPTNYRKTIMNMSNRDFKTLEDPLEFMVYWVKYNIL